MYRLFFGLLLLPSCLVNADDILLSASTENLNAPIIHPEPALVDHLLKEDTDFVEMIDHCKDMQVSPIQLLSDTRLDLNGDKTLDHFIRPVLEPYCFYMYGAHTFSWWLIIEKPSQHYKILFSGYSDALDILQTQHQGQRDLRVKNATAIEMMTYEFHYQDDVYKMVDCKLETFNENHKSSIKPCDN